MNLILYFDEILDISNVLQIVWNITKLQRITFSYKLWPICTFYDIRELNGFK